MLAAMASSEEEITAASSGISVDRLIKIAAPLKTFDKARCSNWPMRLTLSCNIASANPGASEPEEANASPYWPGPEVQSFSDLQYSTLRQR